MNSHPDEKFIYITPYLNETARIRESCPGLDFIEPSDKMVKYKFKKSTHAAELIAEGKNIAATHQLFLRYTNEMLDNIRKHGYTLILDESLNMFETVETSQTDIDILCQTGYLERRPDGRYVCVNAEYDGGVDMYRRILERCREQELIDLISHQTKGKNTKYGVYNWRVSPTLISSFGKVYVLTYLFESPEMWAMFACSGLEYKKIGVCVDENGKHQFSESGGYVPDYVKTLPGKIHIIQDNELNYIGRDKTALSMSWMKRDPSGVDVLRKNIRYVFRTVWGDETKNERMWCTYSEDKNKLRGEGFTKAFTPFNLRATNEYADRTRLVFAVNIFCNVGQRMFYMEHGVALNEDLYALSTMIQWVWRSAIRNGKEIYLYVPSKRMRTLFTQWMDMVSKGGVDVGRICYSENM